MGTLSKIYYLNICTCVIKDYKAGCPHTAKWKDFPNSVKIVSFYFIT